MLRTIPVLALLFTAVLSVGCGDDNETPTTPTDPVQPTSEFFDGTLTVNGAQTHTFIVQRPGTATATLTELTPDSAAVISLALGTWNGQTCQIILANDASTTSSSVVGTASAGNFCLRVSDVGRLTAPTGYKVTVSHF